MDTRRNVMDKLQDPWGTGFKMLGRKLQVQNSRPKPWERGIPRSERGIPRSYLPNIVIISHNYYGERGIPRSELPNIVIISHNSPFTIIIMTYYDYIFGR